MKLIADTRIEQEVRGVHLEGIKIAGKKYSLNVSEYADGDGQLWLSLRCDDGAKIWMIIDNEIHINRDSDPDHNSRGLREAFLSIDGYAHGWHKWSECSGQESGREKGVEFGCPPKETTNETAR